MLELPRRVRLSGHGGILTSRSGDLIFRTARFCRSKVLQKPGTMEECKSSRLNLPGAWRALGKTVFYHFSGACGAAK